MRVFVCVRRCACLSSFIASTIPTGDFFVSFVPVPPLVIVVFFFSYVQFHEEENRETVPGKSLLLFAFTVVYHVGVVE